MNKKTIGLGVGILLALFSSIGYGQEYRGRVQGIVTDASQATVVGATVELRNVNTGVASTRHTGTDGLYLFDLVEPGTYTVTAEMSGFSKFVQQNVLVQSRGDVTVNAVLQIGKVSAEVTVTGTPAAVEFNTSKVQSTLGTRLMDDLPNVYRSPYLLALLDPAVENPNDGQSSYQPYNTWGQNHLSVGGGGLYTNALELDGSSQTLGVKTSYVPSSYSIEELVVQQNSVDAEIGHSSGSAISLVTKSGTNDWHGRAWYQGAYPWLNALEDRHFRTPDVGRNNMFGATLGNPILKNKLFNFFAWEQWRKVDPQILQNTLPTDLERQGDFSQSLNASGALRTIYDPWSTATAADGTVTRAPFPGNVIPQNRIDPVAASFISELWQPNRAGDGPFHIDNYVANLPLKVGYKNYSDRVDYNVSDKVRIYGRFGIIRTPSATGNPTGSKIYVSDRGAWDDALTYGGDMAYTLNPNTVLDVHGDWHRFQDDATAPQVVSGSQGWGEWWPNSDWYAPLFQNKQLPVFIPRMEVHRAPWEQLVNMGMGAGYWFQHPDGDSFAVKLSHQQASHYLKFGFDTMSNSDGGGSYVAESPGFGFMASTTANTYLNPDVTESGDGYATFLLGAVEPGGWGWGGGQTTMPIVAMKKISTRSYGSYVNDDWKVSRRLTLNLGLRYEFEGAYTDPEHHLGRPFDPNNPIPEMQANPVQMPALVQQYYTGPWIFNGAFNFTDASHPTEWNSGSGTLSPRIGAAYKLNEKTAVRAAWARYYTPWVKLITGHNFLDVGYPGFDSYTGACPALQGVPQMHLGDGFTGNCPLIQPVGKTLGRYTQLGDYVSTVYGDRARQHSDRINFTFERQLADQMVLNVTYFLNWTDNVVNNAQSYTNSIDLDRPDPRLWYQNKGAMDQTAANPFYNYLTPDKFPGPLRYQPFVTVGQLARPYPQYTGINFDQYPGGLMHYQSLQLKFTRNFSKGYTLLAGYNYHYETDTVFYDDVASYLRTWTWQPSANRRHRLSIAGVWDLPLGRHRAFLGNIPRAVDEVVGGWQLNGITSWTSGDFLQFGGLLVSGNPVISHPTLDQWFNTSVFQPLPSYTERTNPWQYPGLTGPGMFNLDASLSKSFSISEKVKFQFQVQAFNALNGFTAGDPSTDIFDPNFGKSLYQATSAATSMGQRLQYGRRFQLGGSIVF